MEEPTVEQQKRFEAWKKDMHHVIDRAELSQEVHVVVVYGTHSDITITGNTCGTFLLQASRAMVKRGVELITTV